MLYKRTLAVLTGALLAVGSGGGVAAALQTGQKAKDPKDPPKKAVKHDPPDHHTTVFPTPVPAVEPVGDDQARVADDQITVGDDQTPVADDQTAVAADDAIAPTATPVVRTAAFTG